MLDIKRTKSLAALVGAAALMMGAPALAQAPAAAPAAAASDAAPASDAAAPAASGSVANGGAIAAPTQMKKAAGPIQMFLDAEAVVKVVMVGLLLCSIFT